MESTTVESAHTKFAIPESAIKLKLVPLRMETSIKLAIPVVGESMIPVLGILVSFGAWATIKLILDQLRPADHDHCCKSPIEKTLKQMAPSSSYYTEEHSKTTLYVSELGRWNFTSRTRPCRWHAINIRRGFKLGTSQELPVLPLREPLADFQTAMLGTRLFVAGGWWYGGSVGSKRVYSIDTANITSSGWQDSHFTTPRCSPHLVVFGGSLYAFGYGTQCEDYVEREDASLHWAEVYDGQEWKHVPLSFNSRSCTLPPQVSGHVLDSKGRLLLFGHNQTLRCDIKQGRCNITVIQSSLDNHLVLHPARIGNCLYTCEYGSTAVNCHDIETKMFSRPVIFKKPESVPSSGSFDPLLAWELIPVHEDALYSLQLFGKFNDIAETCLHHVLRCEKYLVRGKADPYFQASEIEVSFRSIHSCMISSTVLSEGNYPPIPTVENSPFGREIMKLRRLSLGLADPYNDRISEDPCNDRIPEEENRTDEVVEFPEWWLKQIGGPERNLNNFFSQIPKLIANLETHMCDCPLTFYECDPMKDAVKHLIELSIEFRATDVLNAAIEFYNELLNTNENLESIINSAKKKIAVVREQFRSLCRLPNLDYSSPFFGTGSEFSRTGLEFCGTGSELQLGELQPILDWNVPDWNSPETPSGSECSRSGSECSRPGSECSRPGSVGSTSG